MTQNKKTYETSTCATKETTDSDADFITNVYKRYQNICNTTNKNTNQEMIPKCRLIKVAFSSFVQYNKEDLWLFMRHFSIKEPNFCVLMSLLMLTLFLPMCIHGQNQTITGRLNSNTLGAGLVAGVEVNQLMIFPRRRSFGVEENEEMQSRAVDTRAQFKVSEGEPYGTSIGFIPTKPNFTYRFNEVPLEFILDAVSGEIKTNIVLDREDMSDRYDLVVLSSQPTYPIEVCIIVTDINDNAPKFPEPSIAVSFSESAVAGTRLLLDAATDRDIGENSVTDDYCIIDGNYDNKFRLAVTSNPSGDVSYLHLETTSNLDRESMAHYQLNISSRDNGKPPKYGYLQVNVTILDVNDNPPIFDHSDYIVSINESVPPGSVVLQVMASDSDMGENSKIRYFLDDAALDGENQFTVDPYSGVISTTNYLNCPQSCVFTVYAHDNGSPRQDGRTYVTVNLVDANDHDPIIQLQYLSGSGNIATVDENALNGTVVAAISILDKDEGSNGETSVRIAAGNDMGHFALINNVVSVNDVLDREEISIYNLTIVATDKGNPPRTAMAHLSIHVNDVNDHEPVFEKSEYSAVLSELVPVGTYVATILAFDEDTGINADIYYDFVSGNNMEWFAIDSSSGLITTRLALDRELQDSVELNISARDGGPNPKWAYAQLKITVLDENDEAPRFIERNINVTLSESTRIRTAITILTAVDNDQGTNGSVTYSLPSIVTQKYPQQFELDTLTGQLITRSLLDREKVAYYEIYVVARDQGTPPQSASATVHIFVEDINDNNPEFYPLRYFYALADDELDNNGSRDEKFLLKVTAVDRDEGNNALITYKLEEGDHSQFSVDSFTGAVTLRVNENAIDMWQGQNSVQTLRISAKDQGNRQSVQDALVEIVLQSKIETLEFDSFGTYNFQIVEDHINFCSQQFEIARDVGRVQVNALKSSTMTSFLLPNAIEYSIMHGDIQQRFAIDQNGDIKTAQCLDRETEAEYHLIVGARVNLAFGKCLVNIKIMDLNDNPPIFEIQEHDNEIILPENAAVGQEVYLSRAYDRDDGNNSLLHYALTFNPNWQFHINNQTGVIYLQKPINAEPNTLWHVEITATDTGVKPLSTKHTITLLISDVNDHTPVFDHTSYETSLIETTKVNTRFFAVPASDADLGMNGQIFYDIRDGNSAQKFGIFPDGYLYVRLPLDREEHDYYALTVVCHDAGLPSRSSFVPVIIHVIDENDNAPIFSNDTFIFSIAENEPADSFVGKLTATDRDIGHNAELFYSLTMQGKDFSIDPRNGFIRTLYPFDREELIHRIRTQNEEALQIDLNFIVFEAVVSDNGIKHLYDKVKVKVIVTDVNDNAPQFERTPYHAEISEGSNVGSDVMRVYAIDADDELNGFVNYAIIAGNHERAFELDEITGKLTLLRCLDREKNYYYTLTIIARDNAENKQQLTSTTTITIDVLDENDVAPEFEITSNELSLKETTSIDTEIFRFSAIDLDLGLNSQIAFSISGGNKRDTFHIDASTGSLSLHKKLDFEETTAYSLNITASDSGIPRLTTSLLFNVIVVDVNDNSPIFPNTAVVRQIREGIPLNTPIVTVTAEDPDSGLNGKVAYAIVRQQPESVGGAHFGINASSGVIYTLREIDRETIDTFRLTVRAKDQNPEIQLSADKLVTVIVEDINDNSPVFVSMNAAILPMQLNKNREKGSHNDDDFIMFVQAQDADASSNGLVTYEIVNGNTELFQLHRYNGALSLRKTIENPAPIYHLTIKASDEAVQSERKSSEVFITVITKHNDDGMFSPTFDQLDLTGSVYENEPVSTSILTIMSSFNSTEVEYYVTNITESISGKQVDRLFDIDTKLGILSTARELDREAGPHVYMVEVYTLAVGSISNLITTTVRVTVLDKNDSPPVFIGTPLYFNVSEYLEIGHKIAIIQAEDLDTLGTLSYSLMGGDDGKFMIETNTGELLLKDALDRESTELYNLQIRVTDGVFHTDTIVTIGVMDTNDNPPTFDLPVYSFEIPENASRGYQVGIIKATDPDLGSNSIISYTVLSDWGNDMFSLNPQTGVFTLSAKLDYENVEHYILVVQAQDNGNPSLYTTTSVYLNVLDLNDNAPKFNSSSYSKNILENIAIGTSVIKITASDLDSGENGRIEYNITAGDENGDFDISSDGIISTRHELDRETKAIYTLIVTATDCATQFSTYQPIISRRQRPYLQHIEQHYLPQQILQERLSSSVQVTITLDDVNDDVPTFISPKQTSVLENIALNSVVMTVKAIDKDDGRNGYIEYSLTEEQWNKTLPFSLGTVDGVLRVTGPLDRELHSTYLLNVTARDRGDPSLISFTQIQIKLLDENDNSPVFDPRLYSASVAENASIGAMVLQVSATDIDEDSNGRVRYSIVAGDINHDFSISEDSGVVRVAKNLNYERRSRYVLTVHAEDCAMDVNSLWQSDKALTDKESRYDTAELTIVITDINDNSPTFLDSPYVTYVMENVMPPNDGYLLKVFAHDADTPPFNSQVRYFFKEADTEIFRINASSGDISLLRALDREDQAEHTLTLVAMDMGSPPLTGTGIVRVIVNDMNDCSPEFKLQLYKGSVLENVPTGTAIMSTVAEDRDVGLNSEIRYSLRGNQVERFKINSESGEICTAAILDREETALYFLTVLATDSSTTDRRSTIADIIISVEDVNDNSPIFDATSFKVNVPDYMERNEFVFSGNAIDSDFLENAELIYNISGKDVDKFYINAKTGVIKTKRALNADDHMNALLSLLLSATDSGVEPRSTIADLTILQRPASMFPKFSKMPNTHFVVSEDATAGKFITQISATSSKSSSTGNIEFKIASGNKDDAVFIDTATGVLSVGKGGCDYETAHQYEIWIEVSNSDSPALRSFMLVTINVTDINDNVPIFEKNIYYAEVLEEEPPPQIIQKVQASDSDSGTNGEISYRLADDFDGIFDIDSDSGEIFTISRLDREERSYYKILVEAVDQGMPQMVGSATVFLTLLDKNDNPPKFTRLYSVNVTENIKIGSFVIQVNSVDLDIGINANASYSISENPGNKFNLNSSNGNITVADYLDREQQDEYLLKIVASDGAWRAETPITITIQDQNDNAPEFEHSYYSFNFPELQRSVHFVGQVLATDRDKQGPNSIISYSLQQPSDFFTIDPAKGEIFSKRSVKYKHSQLESFLENMFVLQVLATDNGTPPLYSECTVQINVVGFNNNAPKFIQKDFLAAVPEDAKVGQRIVKIQAEDEKDYGVNAKIDYSVIGGNATGYFKIDKREGWLTVAKTLNVSSETKFVITVKATDRGVPPKSDEVNVTVIVTSENLYTPEFTALSYQVYVPENEPIGSTILTVSASDRDEGPNGMLRYSITGLSVPKEFDVNTETGAIFLLQSLDYDTVQEYHLNITVRDLAYLSKSAVSMITIILTDVNDNPPIFNQSEYNAYVAENKPSQTFIFQIHATDKDSPKNAIIRYAIIDGSGQHLFDIDELTGEIVTSVVFDYEQQIEYSVQIRASNIDPYLYSTCILRIHITSVNEFYPHFVQPIFHFDVSESSEIGTVVGGIQASDMDKGPDGKIYYILVGSSNERGFAINMNSGVISTSRSLDRETQSRVVLTVMAKNYGPLRGNDFDEAQVIILIQDGNDPPQFLNDIYTASVLESAVIGTEVTKVKASDKDIRKQNNQFIYSFISGNINQAFKIDAVSGVIETFKELDRENIPLYELIVGAIDTGLPPQTGTTTVKVTIEDVNDNSPTFAPNELVGYLSENEPPGSIIMTLTAHDADLKPNGAPFIYQLVGGKDFSMIAIDKHSGVVRSIRSYDRERTPILEAIIEVEDNGNPKQKAQHTITIKVLDQNDNPSTSRRVHILVYVFGNKINPVKIGNVRPNDADIVGNYNCRFVPNNNSSPLSSFALPNACDIYATLQTAFKEYSYFIAGDDGKHAEVISSVNISFRQFDQETLSHATTLLLYDMQAEYFLEMYYQKFVQLVNTHMQNDDQLIIFSLQNSITNTSNMEIYLAIETENHKYRPKNFVTEYLTKNHVAIENLLESPIRVVIAYNPCSLSNSCENGGICSAELHLIKDTQSLNVIDSPSVIFTSPMVVQDYVCKCPEHFIGIQCNKKKDPCTPNPCEANAQCRRIVYDFECICPTNRTGKYCHLNRGDVCSGNPCRNGGSCRYGTDGVSFFCICRTGYRGNQCEFVADACRPNPCMHGGNCILLNPGYKCNCFDGHYGKHCEKSVFGFQEMSYMAFSALDAVTNDISIIFATTNPDVLLAYNYGAQTGGRSDFVAVELVNGKVFFSFGGARTAITTLTVGANEKQNFADGNWYKINALRNGRVMSLSVGTCTENGDICEDCRQGDPNCYANDIGSISSLNFNKNYLLIGGLESVDSALERSGQIHTDDFVGCIHSVIVNGRVLNMSSPLKQHEVLPTCNRIGNEGPCQKKMAIVDKPSTTICGAYEVCVDRWQFAMCQCGGQLLSPDCFGTLEPITLVDGFIEFKISEKHRRMQLLDNFYGSRSLWSYEFFRSLRYTFDHDNVTTLAQNLNMPKSVSLNFRTFKPDGLLFYAATNKHYTAVQLRSGKLFYQSMQNTLVNMSDQEPERLNNGKWHNLTLYKWNRILRVFIDNKKVGEELDFAGIHDYLDPYLTVLSVGGVTTEYSAVSYTNFEGCLANFSINNEIQPFTNLKSSSVFQEVIWHGKLSNGCSDNFGIGAAQVSESLTIGVTLVIVFFVILMVAIAGSYIIYLFRGKPDKIGKLSCGVPGLNIKHSVASTILGSSRSLQNPTDHEVGRGVLRNESDELSYHNSDGELLGSGPGHHLLGTDLISKKIKERDKADHEQHQQPRSQRPDIIEREVVNKTTQLRGEQHSHLSLLNKARQALGRTSSVDMGSDYPEHYDLENASSIAPSDIDIVYHYNRYREAGGVRKHNTTSPLIASYTHHKHPTTVNQGHRHSPHHLVGAPFVQRAPHPQASQPPTLSCTQLQHQSTPLARLSPSSELSSQQPRILTLKDISGKPLQSALLATTSSSGGVGKDPLHSNSERSLNSPVMSHLSEQSSTTSHQKNSGNPAQKTSKTPISLTAEEIKRLNVRPRASNLLSTLDAVPSSSQHVPASHLALGEGLHTTDVDAHSSSSTDESGNDSFTCSEIEYDNNSLSGDVNKYQTNHVAGDPSNISNGSAIDVAKVPPLSRHAYDGFDSSFRGSLSTLVASDDDLSTHIGLYRKKTNGEASPSSATLGWDYLLNWGPNFETLVGVFNDIAELPDTVNERHIATALLHPNDVQKASEEFI